jgi:two-component system, NtrC family, sensor histidine kinase HydH
MGAQQAHGLGSCHVLEQLGLRNPEDSPCVRPGTDLAPPAVVELPPELHAGQPPLGEGRVRARRSRLRLVDAACELSATLDAGEVERRAVEAARSLLRAPAAALFLEREGWLALGRTAGDAGAAEDLRAIAIRALGSSEPIADGTALAARLRGGERILGALAVRRRPDHAIRARERVVLGLLARHAAVTLENAVLHAEARDAGERLRESEKLAALGRLSAGLAHELRNPLNTLSILTFAMLERAGEREGELADLEVLRNEIRRMDLLLEQFLSFARPRPPRFARLDVRSVLDGTVRLLAPEARKRRAGLDLHADPRPRPVWADADQLSQVFLNLALNALQATSRGGQVTIFVELAGGGVVVRVADDGPGIPEHVRDRLFEPFVTTKPEGSGLGLAVARRIVESHSGRLELESKPGAGTIATVWLPS